MALHSADQAWGCVFVSVLSYAMCWSLALSKEEADWDSNSLIKGVKLLLPPLCCLQYFVCVSDFSMDVWSVYASVLICHKQLAMLHLCSCGDIYVHSLLCHWRGVAQNRRITISCPSTSFYFSHKWDKDWGRERGEDSLKLSHIIASDERV